MTKINLKNLIFNTFKGFLDIKVCKMSSIQDSSDLFSPESRDLRKNGDKISPSYLFFSSLKKLPKLPGTNVHICY